MEVISKSFILFAFITKNCHIFRLLGLPWWLRGKESACSAGDPGSVPGSGRSPGEGKGNPLQYCCLENSVDRPWSRKEADTAE